MKKTLNKAQKSAIISSLTLNLIFFIWFIWSIIYYLYPNYLEVNANKEKLIEQIDKYNKLEKKGMSFVDFRSSSAIKEVWISHIIQDIDQDFFNLNFENNTSDNYIKFLDKKQIEINKIKESDILIERDKTISRVLPFYSQWILTDWSVSDLWFINYLENLFRSFNLKSNDPIWITDIIPYSEYEDINNNSLSSNLFYIPLNFTLEWRKSDILDFIYYIQNIAVIKEITEDDNIVFYSDNLLNRNINLSKNLQNNNIYESRIMEITSLKLREYIDSWLDFRRENEKTVQGLINFIRNDNIQNKESYIIDIWINFYLRWLPSYELNSYISNIEERFYEISWKVRESLTLTNNKRLTTSNRDLVLIENFLRDLDSYLKELEWKVDEMNLWWLDRNIDEIYKIALDVNKNLEPIEKAYEKNLKKLNNILGI